MPDVSLSEIIQLLLPDLGAAFSGDSHAMIIVVFVGLILAVFAATMLWIVLLARSARRELSRLAAIGSYLEGDAVIARVTAVTFAAGTNTADYLWREFDETLVEDRSTVTNTVPAEEHFSLEQIAPVLSSSRLLAAMPSVLTALGLLGTFIGLAVGLNGLNLSESADVEELRGGIEAMVAGAALGFTASVWGVATSLVVNFTEKAVIGHMGGRARTFQQKVDGYFHQHSPERALLEIERNTRETSSAMEELHEKIGHSLQEAVTGMTAAMQDALAQAIHGSMAPSLDALADRTSNQSAEVFEKLIEKFSDGFQSMGAQQSEEMTRAAGSLQTTMASITEGIGSALGEMQTATTSQAAASAEQAEGFRVQVVELTSLTTQLINSLNGSLGALAQRLDTASTAVENSSRALASSSSTLDNTASTFSTTGRDLNASLVATAESNARVAGTQSEVATAFASYAADFQKMNDASEETINQVTRTSDEAAATFKALRDSQRTFLHDLKSRVEELNDGMAEWLTEYGERVKYQTSDRMDEWDKQTREFASHMMATSQALAGVVDEISTKVGPSSA